MREFRELPIDAINETVKDNVRQSFSEEKLEELAASIRQRGVLKPILVRPDGNRFTVIDGARRLRAAKRADCKTIPARVRQIDDDAAEEEMIIANLHHEDMTPLDEAAGYQRLLDKGRTVNDLATRLGKPKRYIYEHLTLMRLVPQAQELVRQEILPLAYALKLAAVPAERQPEGLGQCFRPLFREEPRRDQLEPLANLTAWMEKSVRLDPRSEDVQVLLPNLAEQVQAAEEERKASLVALSTLHFHTEKSEPRPILAKGWKPAEGKERCKFAQPGVIVLGEGQGTLLQVCIAKKKCEKHWGRPKSKNGQPTADQLEAEAERKRQEATWARQQQEQERWRKDLRPRALQFIAERTAKLAWNRTLLLLLLDELNADGSFVELIGKPAKLPTRRYPQAVAVAIALRRSWRREDLIRLGKRLGVAIPPKVLQSHAENEEGAATEEA